MRNTAYISRFRSCSRLQTLLLYFCLILSLTWYESGFSAPTPAVIAGPFKKVDISALGRAYPYRLPSLLAAAPKLSSLTRIRPENRDDELPPIQPLPREGFVNATPCLPSLRIDPVAWNSRTPSFLLPSSYGLVPFSIPPPFCFVQGSAD